MKLKEAGIEMSDIQELKHHYGIKPGDFFDRTIEHMSNKGYTVEQIEKSLIEFYEGEGIKSLKETMEETRKMHNDLKEAKARQDLEKNSPNN